MIPDIKAILTTMKYLKDVCVTFPDCQFCPLYTGKQHHHKTGVKCLLSYPPDMWNTNADAWEEENEQGKT